MSDKSSVFSRAAVIKFPRDFGENASFSKMPSQPRKRISPGMAVRTVKSGIGVT